jgi:hypothetical protein
LQLALQPTVHTINIPTGNVQATDFGKMTAKTTQTLVDNGVIATKKFFDQERMHVRSTARRDGLHPVRLTPA